MNIFDLPKNSIGLKSTIDEIKYIDYEITPDFKYIIINKRIYEIPDFYNKRYSDKLFIILFKILNQSLNKYRRITLGVFILFFRIILC